MIKFKRIEIKNFKSIKKAELIYEAGLWEVIGKNNDSTFVSNGAGKSTALEALQQGLFNKNSKGIKIEETYNRFTKKAYCITIEFEKGQDSYKVVNNRAKQTIEIYQNDELLRIKGTPKNLNKIKEILGIDFNTFVTTTFVSQTTVNSIIENFSSSALMKTILDFDNIVRYEKMLKEELRTSTNIVSNRLAENKGIKESIQMLDGFVKVDLVTLYVHKEGIEDELKVLNEHPDLDELTKELDDLTHKAYELDKEVAELSSLARSECPTCKQHVPESDKYQEVFKHKSKELDDVNNKREELGDNVVTLTSELEVQRRALTNRLKSLEQSIQMGEYKNSLYDENKTKLDELNLRVKLNEEQNQKEYTKQEVYRAALDCIKKGTLHKELLDSFTKALNMFIEDYTPYMDFDRYSIRAKAKKAEIEFIVYDNNCSEFINIDTLSGGELTRARFIVLISTLKAIELITKNSTNILILDEAFDTLDASASSSLNKLLHYIVKDSGVFIGVVSHGQQLKAIEFNGSITATKHHDVTTILQE